MDINERRDFSMFRNEEMWCMTKTVNVERDMRCMNEVMAGILLKQDEMIEQNKELRRKFCNYKYSERMGSNPGHGLNGDWTSTQGNGSQTGGLPDKRSPLGGLLQPINSRKKPTLFKF